MPKSTKSDEVKAVDLKKAEGESAKKEVKTQSKAKTTSSKTTKTTKTTKAKTTKTAAAEVENAVILAEAEDAHIEVAASSDSKDVAVTKGKTKNSPKKIFLDKYLDEKGKLFGLINPMDLAVIILIFLLAIKIISDYRPTPLRAREDQITIGFVVKNISPHLAQSVTVGQLLFHEDTNAYLGKITKHNTKNAEVIIQDGAELLLVRHPQNLDLRLKFTRKGEVITGQSRNGVYLGKLPIRIGDKLKIHTLYATLEGEVESLNVVSEK